MSVKALTWAFEQPINATEKVVLLALADHANEHGVCWPSVSILMKRANVGERTVQRAIQSLEGAGYLTRERRARDNGSDTSNLYRLIFDRTPTETYGNVQKRTDTYGNVLTPTETYGNVRKHTDTLGGANLTPHTDTHSIPMPMGSEGNKIGGVIQTGGDTQTGGEGGLHDTPRTIIKNHHIEPSLSLDAQFDEFWSAYPKRPGNPKAKARGKYKSLRKQKVSHETIVNAARKYAELRRGENPRFTAMAVTWLNQWRFEDDYTTDEENTGSQESEPDENLNSLVRVYPGHVGDRDKAAKLLKAELAKGAKIGDICVAAEKYKLFCKGPPFEDRRITPSMLEPWIQFKWREMDAYEFCRVGADRIKTVRPIKVGK